MSLKKDLFTFLGIGLGDNVNTILVSLLLSFISLFINFILSSKSKSFTFSSGEFGDDTVLA